MITTIGKGLIARALAGQIPSAFSYIALGVGAQPALPVTVIEKPAAAWSGAEVLDDGVWGLEVDTLLAKLGDGATIYSALDYQSTGVLYEDDDIKNRSNLIFEAFRVPVSGASVLFEGGQTKVVLSGVLPSAQRYEFSEIGIYSAESNSALTTQTPRMIYTFSDAEGWEHHTGSTITDVAYAGSVSTNGFDIDSIGAGINPKAFFIAADNPVFFPVDRKAQRMRIYQDALIMRGDISTVDDATSTWALSGEHVHLTGKLVDLTKARPDDEIKIAFAVINKNYNYIDSAGVAEEARVAVRFMSSEESTVHATLQAKVTEGATSLTQEPNTTSFADNGYYVLSFQKKDLVYQPNFSWENVTVAQVFVEVEPGTGQTSADYYVAVDAIRFDSNNNNNPTYGLSAYSAIRNTEKSTETKAEQTESQIEYKITLEVE